MDIISHVFFALMLNQYFDWWVALGSVLPDLDKLYTYPKKRFFRSESHTFAGEIPFSVLFVLIFSLLSLYFGQHLFSLAFGYMSHILLDFLVGETKPFRPFLKDKVDFNLSLRRKAVVGIVVWVSGLYVYGSDIWIFAKQLLGY